MSGNDDTLTLTYAQTFATHLPLGRKPAVIVIDFVNAYITPGAPLYAEAVVDAVAATVPLLAHARAKSLPIIYTRVAYHPNGRDGGLFIKKVPVLRSMIAGEPAAEIVPALPPAPDDLIITKNYASAFFGTSLAATLTAQGIDTLIITGCSTSGCVRATALDAMQYGFVPLVVSDCVGDRHPAPHTANLFDIQAKYGEVLSLTETQTYLNNL